MKYLVIAAIIFSGAALAQSSISLDPGASIAIRAGDDLHVTCEGSSLQTGSEAYCRILDEGDTVSGTGYTCRDDYCAVLVRFGNVVKSRETSRITDAEAACEFYLSL